MHVLTHTSLHTCIHAPSHSLIHPSMQACMNPFILLCTHTCMYPCILPHTHACTYPFFYTHMHACTYHPPHACIYACIHWFFHACAHAYMNTSIQMPTEHMINFTTHSSSRISQELLSPITWLNLQLKKGEGSIRLMDELRNWRKATSKQELVVGEKSGRGNGWGAHISFSKQLLESTGTPPSFSYNWKVLIAEIWRLKCLEFCQVCFLEALSVYLLRENTQNNII